MIPGQLDVEEVIALVEQEAELSKPCCGSEAEHHRIMCPTIVAAAPHWQDQDAFVPCGCGGVGSHHCAEAIAEQPHQRYGRLGASARNPCIPV